MAAKDKIDEAKEALIALGMPRAQRNDRSALCLLALLNLTQHKPWAESEGPLIGITPMMTFAREKYGRTYASNTRETFRRQSMHQFVAAGIAVYNPDQPRRAVNSPKAVYQIEPACLALLRTFGTPSWERNLADYLELRPALALRYAKAREMRKLAVRLPTGKRVRLSPGPHSELIKSIVEEFAPRFAPGAQLVYVGDTGVKWAWFDKGLLAQLGVTVDGHGKMPDVVLHDTDRGWNQPRARRPQATR